MCACAIYVYDRVPFCLRCIFSIFAFVLECILDVVLTIGGDRLHLGKFDVNTFSVVMMVLLLGGVSQAERESDWKTIRCGILDQRYECCDHQSTPSHYHYSALSKLHSVPEISITLTETWIEGGMRLQNKYKPPNAEIHNTRLYYTHSSDGAAPSSAAAVAAFAITNDNDDTDKREKIGEEKHNAEKIATRSRDNTARVDFHTRTTTHWRNRQTFLCNKTEPAAFFTPLFFLRVF